MDNSEKIKEHKRYRERFVRWQQLAIKHLSFVNNLFLVLNLAFIGFLIDQNTLKFININCWVISVQIIIFLALGISFFSGIYTVWIRLRDFRATHQLVKNKKDRFEYKKLNKKHQNLEKIEFDILKYQMLVDKLGPRTWTYLGWQIWSFFIGVIIGVIYLIFSVNEFH